MKKTIMMLSLALVSLGAFAQHNHEDHNSSNMGGMESEPMFKDKAMGTAYANYIELKEALVDSDFESASKASASLEKSLSEVESSEVAQSSVSKVRQAGDLKEQRKAFAELTSEMSKLIKGGNLSMGEIYLEFCPMSNNNEGAYWLSNTKEIRNPFLGKKMLNCGMVKETIN